MKLPKISSLLPTLLLLIGAAQPATAQNTSADGDNLCLMSSQGWEWQVNAGLNIGGATPLGLPRELRKMHSYNPRLNASLQGKVVKWWGEDRKWGSAIGIGIEQKGMKTATDVKNYHMEIIRDNDRVSGYWTGYVDIDYASTFITIPLTANYRFNDRWRASAGLFGSFLLDGHFSGYVKDGYLRSGTPIGEKIVYTDGSRAAYDFNDDLRKFVWGIQMGASWRAYRHFSVNVDATYSFNSIFRSDFTTVTNTMHPIFANIGVGYTF